MRHWLGAIGAQNISNWKLPLFAMKNSCVDTKLFPWSCGCYSSVWLLSELVPQVNVPAACVGREAGAVLRVSHQSGVAARRLAPPTRPAATGRSAQIGRQWVRSALTSCGRVFPDVCLTSGSRRGRKGWNQRRSTEDLGEPWLRSVQAGCLCVQVSETHVHLLGHKGDIHCGAQATLSLLHCVQVASTWPGKAATCKSKFISSQPSLPMEVREGSLLGGHAGQRQETAASTAPGQDGRHSHRL